MPKITWMNRPNYLEGLLKAYKRSRGLTSEQIAEKLNCSPATVRAQLANPAKSWKIGTLLRYCDVLGVPYEEAFEAAAK